METPHARPRFQRPGSVVSPGSACSSWLRRDSQVMDDDHRQYVGWDKVIILKLVHWTLEC